MTEQYIHYDYGKDIKVVLKEAGETTGWRLEDITDIYLDEFGHFLTFKNYYGEEVMTIAYHAISYWRID